MDISALVGKVTGVATSLASMIPGMNIITGGVELGKKVIDIIDELGDDIPLDQQAEAQAARAALAEAVKAKAAATSDRLRGGH